MLLGKPVGQLRNGNYDLGANQYMLFEAEPPMAIADHVHIDKPDPTQHPDAYDSKGELVDMYKDPDMMLGTDEQGSKRLVHGISACRHLHGLMGGLHRALFLRVGQSYEGLAPTSHDPHRACRLLSPGFAERIKTHPNPHTKYDKCWVGPLAANATVSDLCAAINALFADAGLTVSMITAPTQRVECDKDDDHPNGLKAGARTLWSAMLPGTKANLDRPWAALLLELTSRSDTYPTVDPPEDVAKRTLYSRLVVSVQVA